MIARRKFRTKEARKRERIRITLVSIGAILISFLIIVLLVYVSHFEFLRIKHIHTQTNGILETQELASVIQTEIDGYFVKFFPKDSVFVMSYGSVERAIQDIFPRIKSAEIKRVNFYSLNASISERSPAALWCGDLVPPVAQTESRGKDAENSDIWGSCFLVDDEGFIYAKAPHFSGNIYPRYYGSLEKAEPIAQQYIPIDQFTLWQEFYTSIESNEVVIQAVLFVDERDVEVYLTNGIQVLVPRGENLEIIKQRLLAVLESGEIDKHKEVEYIDLRFGKKAFIKYFGEKVENDEE